MLSSNTSLVINTEDSETLNKIFNYKKVLATTNQFEETLPIILVL